ncbi:MAG: L,D-transpeptidase [Gammaproteobacteria bacterium]|nr:L,D-transpeptidase [Gammaproteobacteria bacterium]
MLNYSNQRTSGTDFQSLAKRCLYVSVAEQKLQLVDKNKILFDVKIATAKNGVGEQFGSECTPRGWHNIRAKIGTGCPENTVFIARRPTGELCSEELQKAHPDRDWILTRILWLSGLEVGFNRLGKVDTMRRYIYIHGCPDTETVGIPGSHGCIRMRNSDIIALFDLVEVAIPVFIDDRGSSIA